VLERSQGWRGAFLAQAYFESAPDSLLAFGPDQYRAWTELGLALAADSSERDFFARLPRGFAAWSAGDRDRLLAIALGLVGGAPAHARTVYRELPVALEGLTAAERAAALAALAPVDARAAGALALFAPVVGAVLHEVPAAERVSALALVEELAREDSEAAVAAFRVLPRLYEEARPSEVQAWFAAGRALAAGNPAVGRAYFGLESRTSVRILRAASTAADLQETQGVWRKLVQMVSSGSVSVHGVEPASLRPPLEEDPATGAVALPVRVDWLPAHEENCAVYCFLALQLAGRREFGTYADGALVGRLLAEERSELLEELFGLAEGVRVQHRLAAAYRGVAADSRRLGARLLARWGAETAPTRQVVLDALLLLALGAPRPPGGLSWLPERAAAAVLALLAPLSTPGATVDDSLAVAEALAGALTGAAATLVPAAELPEAFMLDDVTGGEPLDVGGAEVPGPVLAGARPDTEEERPTLELGPESEENTPGGRPLTLEEIRRLIEAGARISQGTGDEPTGGGLPITDLAGKLPRDALDALRKTLAEAGGAGGSSRSGERAAEERAWFYDEWDHHIGDYRSRWCRLHEVSLPGDSGEFFGRALADHARLLPEVRRQFQRIRPESYQVVRGLEDGEDFDLAAVTDARIDVRARRAPSTRVYRSRVREARDVATLFLLDMSASTDEACAPGRRIIDALKEALVVMTEALDELGDAYAILGFSGQGRDNVEVYPVKGFAERLGPSVKARIGGIAPRRSTRMGAALRHAVFKMSGVGARVKHLILLSDGFPQDDDYGDDRRSHVYGMRDTAAALREASAAGVTPFCITVDRAGHDYLREMCDASRYLVIDDVTALPRELPKIYRRVVRG
jgi:hypothetical protein